MQFSRGIAGISQELKIETQSKPQLSIKSVKSSWMTKTISWRFSCVMGSSFSSVSQSIGFATTNTITKRQQKQQIHFNIYRLLVFTININSPPSLPSLPDSSSPCLPFLFLFYIITLILTIFQYTFINQMISLKKGSSNQETSSHNSFINLINGTMESENYQVLFNMFTKFGVKKWAQKSCVYGSLEAIVESTINLKKQAISLIINSSLEIFVREVMETEISSIREETYEKIKDAHIEKETILSFLQEMDQSNNQKITNEQKLPIQPQTSPPNVQPVKLPLIQDSPFRIMLKQEEYYSIFVQEETKIVSKQTEATDEKKGKIIEEKKDIEEISAKNIRSNFPQIRKYLSTIQRAQTQLNEVCQRFSWKKNFVQGKSKENLQKFQCTVEIFIQHPKPYKIIGNCPLAHSKKEAKHEASRQALFLIYSQIKGVWDMKAIDEARKKVQIIISDKKQGKCSDKKVQSLYRPQKQVKNKDFITYHLDLIEKESKLLGKYFFTVRSFSFELEKFVQHHSYQFMGPQWATKKLEKDWLVEGVVFLKLKEKLVYRYESKHKNWEIAKLNVCLVLLKNMVRHFPKLWKSWVERKKLR